MIDRLIKLTEVFKKHCINYVFIGKGAAILYGYPGTTQDIDIFPKKSLENCKKLVEALKELDFNVDKIWFIRKKVETWINKPETQRHRDKLKLR
ncbi:MAG: hypothetical protein HY097_02155, partial [Nitrospinae bacterium]|nr:hypothetical protein [Nitrospinota bacterium]